jgi:iron complex transport system ATP-binding protein
VSAARLSATHLTFGYDPGVPVVRDVSVDVAAGEVLFLLGHNGSGKTSLLACLSGVQRADAGTVTLGGADVYAMAPAERAQRIGIIPQLHVAVFAYEVLDVVLMGRAPHLASFAAPTAQDRAIALEALERVGLTDAQGRRYTELSGGERQLVMVARGLTQRCEVLLMDEPDAHLDPRNQFRVLEVVSDLARDQGLSFVVSSHAPNSALLFADRVLLLRRGRTLALGSVTETLTEPLLTDAYAMPTEVISKVVGGRRMPRAIVPRRIDVVPEGVSTLALEPDALAQPDSLLAALLQRGRDGPQRLLVTGARGAGKSEWCSRLAAAARRQGWRVAGVLSPAVVQAGRKVGIDLVEVASSERRRLADLRQGSGDGATTERWGFRDATLAWANQALRDAAQAQPDLLLIDELGPLELQRGTGLAAGLAAVDGLSGGLACAVVRPALLSAALTRWPDALVVDVED